MTRRISPSMMRPLSNAKWVNPEIIDNQTTLNGLCRLYLCVQLYELHLCVCVCVQDNNKERSQDTLNLRVNGVNVGEVENKGHGMDWRDERKGGILLIIF